MERLTLNTTDIDERLFEKQEEDNLRPWIRALLQLPN